MTLRCGGQYRGAMAGRNTPRQQTSKFWSELKTRSCRGNRKSSDARTMAAQQSRLLLPHDGDLGRPQTSRRVQEV